MVTDDEIMGGGRREERKRKDGVRDCPTCAPSRLPFAGAGKATQESIKRSPTSTSKIMIRNAV
jgi:hypothetical protein